MLRSTDSTRLPMLLEPFSGDLACTDLSATGESRGSGHGRGCHLGESAKRVGLKSVE